MDYRPLAIKLQATQKRPSLTVKAAFHEQGKRDTTQTFTVMAKVLLTTKLVANKAGDVFYPVMTTLL